MKDMIYCITIYFLFLNGIKRYLLEMISLDISNDEMLLIFITIDLIILCNTLFC